MALQAILHVGRGNVPQETPEREFIRLLRQSVKFEAFAVIRAFSVIGQPEEYRFLVAESASGKSLRINDGERINND